ncbi:MAG: hypothetical protein IT371_28105 [Deltaproteobacteria bacterium]|nr:hypothetical protein [Deltaproteobacteria bacterium]
MDDAIDERGGAGGAGEAGGPVAEREAGGPDQAPLLGAAADDLEGPTGTSLLRGIGEPLELREQEANVKPTPPTTVPEPTAANVTLTQLPVPESKVPHRELIGRETTSTDSADLGWRVRQAQKGRVGPGSVERRATGESADLEVLPLRSTAAEVATLDAGCGA